MVKEILFIWMEEVMKESLKMIKKMANLLGRRYEGNWKNGKQHGEGHAITNGGKKMKGLWDGGRRVKWLE